MTYGEFLDAVIDGGIRAAKRDYVSRPAMLRGAEAGFVACRAKAPASLADLLAERRKMTLAALGDRMPLQTEEYWEVRSFENEVEWVCNVVSAMLMNEGEPPIVGAPPTARGMLCAAMILGTSEAGGKEGALMAGPWCVPPLVALSSTQAENFAACLAWVCGSPKAAAMKLRGWAADEFRDGNVQFPMAFVIDVLCALGEPRPM